MKKRILVIDDEAPVCRMLKGYLERYGYEVSAVRTRAEALAVLNDEPLHLILLDIILEDDDGLALLAEIKSEHPHMPVIVLTGLGFTEDTFQEAMQNGASGYLSKDFPLAQVLMEVHRVLNYRRTEAVE